MLGVKIGGKAVVCVWVCVRGINHVILMVLWDSSRGGNTCVPRCSHENVFSYHETSHF